jgi:tripartite ATP-independent transporter DctP family solute receptor
MNYLNKITTAAVVFGMAATGAQAADFNMRFHTQVKSPHPYNDIAEHFKKEVEAKSGGRIAVKLFPAASLGKDPAVLGEMGLGTIDFMVSSTNNAVKSAPEYGVFSLPYLFGSFDGLMKAVGPGSPVVKYYRKVYADRKLGLKLLALGGSGTRNMSNSKKPVMKLADIKGFKMRTPPSPVIAETWKTLGTLPVTIAWPELYAGIQTGVAEALESSIPGYLGSKLYEVAPYLALTAHTIQVNHFSMSERSWNKLPADLQALVQQAAIDATAVGVEKAKGYDANLVETLKTKHGVTVTEPDKSEFMAVLKPVQDKFAKEKGLTEVLEMIRANQ